MNFATRNYDFFKKPLIWLLFYRTTMIGLLSYIAREIAKNMQHHGYETEQLDKFWVDSQAFILMAAIVYVIAVIFKKGIEIQSENELTI